LKRVIVKDIEFLQWLFCLFPPELSDMEAATEENKVYKQERGKVAIFNPFEKFMTTIKKWLERSNSLQLCW
jgi:hypothetical protein